MCGNLAVTPLPKPQRPLPLKGRVESSTPTSRPKRGQKKPRRSRKQANQPDPFRPDFNWGVCRGQPVLHLLCACSPGCSCFCLRLIRFMCPQGGQGSQLRFSVLACGTGASWVVCSTPACPGRRAFLCGPPSSKSALAFSNSAFGLFVLLLRRHSVRLLETVQCERARARSSCQS